MNDKTLNFRRSHFRIFLACPITALLDPEFGNLPRDYERFIRTLHQLLRESADSVFLALEREQWGASLMTANVCTPLDFEEMKACDAVVAFPGESCGVAVELGWASALNKPIILLLEEGASYTPMISGLHELPGLRVHTLTIRDSSTWDISPIKSQLRALLSDIRASLTLQDSDIAI